MIVYFKTKSTNQNNVNLKKGPLHHINNNQDIIYVSLFNFQLNP